MGTIFFAIAAAAVGALFAMNVGDADERATKPFITFAEVHCGDGRVIDHRDPDYAEGCFGNGGGIRFVRVHVASPQGGMVIQDGMAPYWPVLVGDCWPTVKYNERSICEN